MEQIKIEELFISQDESLLSAMKKMDELDRKLLIVMDESIFRGLLSLGDIQRYFIKNQTFNSPTKEAMRKNIKVASISDTFDYVKDMMLAHRTEFMPIVDEDGTLNRVVFWEELFGHDQYKQTKKINLPVVIMAGGKGTRLRPITHIIPKPLVPIGERPIIQVIMDNFIEDGCSEFFFSVSYKADMIKGYFNSLKKAPYNITYFQEDKPLGTAGSLSLIKDSINNTFFISNCDIIINQDYTEIYQYHREHRNEMTAVAYVKEMTIPYGTFEVNHAGLLESLIEKPKHTFLINAGLYILEPHLLKEIPENKFFHITHLMEKILARSGNVGVFPISEGSWLDIGRWQEYQKTLKRFGSEIIM